MDEKEAMQAIAILGNIKNHTSWAFEDFKLKKHEAEIVADALIFMLTDHGYDIPPQDIPRAENTSDNE